MTAARVARVRLTRSGERLYKSGYFDYWTDDEVNSDINFFYYFISMLSTDEWFSSFYQRRYHYSLRYIFLRENANKLDFLRSTFFPKNCKSITISKWITHNENVILTSCEFCQFIEESIQLIKLTLCLLFLAFSCFQMNYSVLLIVKIVLRFFQF